MQAVTVPHINIFDEPTVKLTKKQKRQQKQQNGISNTGLKIKPIKPLTPNQEKTFHAYDSDKNLLLTGCPGTGKSFLSIFLALEEILEGNSPFKKLVIFRSSVACRDIGFLPGKSTDKMKVYETPYYGICAELFGRPDAYDILKQKRIIEFESTSFLRSITLRDCIVFVDECQNLNAMEIHSLITRVGENCKVIFSGDIFQTDLNKRKEVSGLADAIKIFKAMNQFQFIEFVPADIVRSQFVKDYITIRLKLEEMGEIKCNV